MFSQHLICTLFGRERTFCCQTKEVKFRSFPICYYRVFNCFVLNQVLFICCILISLTWNKASFYHSILFKKSTTEFFANWQFHSLSTAFLSEWLLQFLGNENAKFPTPNRFLTYSKTMLWHRLVRSNVQCILISLPYFSEMETLRVTVNVNANAEIFARYILKPRNLTVYDPQIDIQNKK